MTSRPSSRRGAPHTLSLNNRQRSSNEPSVSLEEWDAKAPIGELEKTSVAAVKAALDRSSLRFKVRQFLSPFLPNVHA